MTIVKEGRNRETERGSEKSLPQQVSPRGRFRLTRRILPLMMVVGAVFGVACDENATHPDVVEANAKIAQTLGVKEEVLKHPTLSENPDRALPIVMVGMQDRAKLSSTLAAYDRSRNNFGVPADQAALLAAVVNSASGDRSIDDASAVYIVASKKPSVRGNPKVAATLAAVTVTNQDATIDEAAHRHERYMQTLRLDPEQASSMVESSYLIGSSELTDLAYQRILRYYGMTPQTAILLLQAVSAQRNGQSFASPEEMELSVEQTMLLFNEIKGELDEGVSNEVVADLTTTASTDPDKEKRADRAIYFFNSYVGSNNGSYNGAMGLSRVAAAGYSTTGISPRATIATASRFGTAPTQVIQVASAPLAPASAKAAGGIAVSGKAGGTGSGLAAAGKAGSFGGGRGGISGGGASGSG